MLFKNLHNVHSGSLELLKWWKGSKLSEVDECLKRHEQMSAYPFLKSLQKQPTIYLYHYEHFHGQM